MTDVGPKVPLGGLDPARTDPAYWPRFQGRVLESASASLALRRRRAPAGVGDVMLSWSRLVVPATAIAAAFAGLLLVGEAEVEGEGLVAGLEEILWATDEEAEPLPAFMWEEESLGRDHLLLAVEEF